jgi:hypothetical protein
MEMGLTVIACYRPKPGREETLLDVVREHYTVLRGQRLVTEQVPFVMRANDGTVVEVFEWRSEEAKKQAHENDAVKEIWDRFTECSDPVGVGELEESERPFPSFETLGL